MVAKEKHPAGKGMGDDGGNGGDDYSDLIEHDDGEMLSSIEQYAEEVLGMPMSPRGTANMDQRESKMFDLCAQFKLHLEDVGEARIVLRLIWLMLDNIKQCRRSGMEEDEIFREVERKIMGIATAASRSVSGTRSEGG